MIAVAICVIHVIMVGNNEFMNNITIILAARFFNHIYVIITAFATAITAVAAFFSLKNEKEKKRLSVFSDSLRSVMDGVKNSESLDYILSDNYRNDIKTVKEYLGIDSDEKVSLVDFEKIVVNNLVKDDLNISEDEKKLTKERLRKSYNKITYFCDRMKYLYIISEDKDSRKYVLRYFGPLIIKTYEQLKDLIVKTRQDSNIENLFGYYTQLYDLTKEGEKSKQHR